MWVKLAKDIKFLPFKYSKKYYREIFQRGYLIYLFTKDREILSLSLRNLWIFAKDIDEAIDYINLLIKKDKFSDILYLHLGLIYLYKKKDYKKALMYFNRAYYFCKIKKDRQYYKELIQQCREKLKNANL